MNSFPGVYMVLFKIFFGRGGTLCGSHLIKLEAIPSPSQAGTVIFPCMRLNNSHDPSICYLFLFWPLVFVDE